MKQTRCKYGHIIRDDHTHETFNAVPLVLSLLLTTSFILFAIISRVLS